MRRALIATLLAVWLVLPTATQAVTPTNIRGTAVWYRYHYGQAAAGPALRRYLGRHWRYHVVKVCTLGVYRRCIYVKLTDWCACSGRRVIDLDYRSFRRLTPLWHGIVEVRVYR